MMPNIIPRSESGPVAVRSKMDAYMEEFGV